MFPTADDLKNELTERKPEMEPAIQHEDFGTAECLSLVVESLEKKLELEQKNVQSLEKKFELEQTNVQPSATSTTHLPETPVVLNKPVVETSLKHLPY